MLGDLSKFYESNGEPSCVSTGWGDAGGKSYGMYQFSSTMGIVQNYLDWIDAKGYWFAKNLKAETIGSEAFDAVWKNLGVGANKKDFATSQHDYVKTLYYDVACRYLAGNYFTAEKHSAVMQDVIWSRAVQYGPGQIVDMLTEAVHKLGYPNLSYVDHKMFDAAMIKSIYDVCHTEEWTNGSPSLRAGLYSRFEREGQQALEMLQKELQ